MRHVTFIIRTTFALTLALTAARTTLAQAQQTAASPTKTGPWVGTWAASQQTTEPGNLPPAPGLADTTLRQVVHVSLGGKQVRVRFSNAFGPYSNDGLKISDARIAVSAGGSSIKPETDKALTFHGRTSVNIPRGALVISDPIDFDLAPLSDLAVTLHVNDDSKDVTGHPGARCTSYLQAGNAVSAPEMPEAAKTPHWYYLCGVDVPAGNGAAVAILGDSITDGRGSTTDANRRWPDNLARRFQADPRTARLGVLNHGIGGNAVLRGGLGPTALARLDRDVLAQPGVRWLIVLEGINDLGGKKTTAEELIVSFEQIILRAHDRGILVYGATIMPCGESFYFSPELETARQTINTWIRTSGAFDAVIDMDVATRDPQNPTHLLAAADSGDHLHLNDQGYRIMADAVDLKLFLKP